MSALDPHFLGRFMPFLHLVFDSLFPCPTKILHTAEGKRIHIKSYRRLYDEARALASPNRQLEYSVEQGWGPLCDFLGVKAPVDIAFPNVNDSGNFAIWVKILKRQSLNKIVKRWSLMLGVLTAVALAFSWVARRSVILTHYM